jgi:hypothetical protein
MSEPFEPSRFLVLAKELGCQPTDEARLRSAVGRAYYSIFLIAREKTGVPHKRNVHARTHAALKKMPGCRMAGDMLSKLSRLREVADYELLPKDPLHKDWTQNWSHAQQLADQIARKVQ